MPKRVIWVTMALNAKHCSGLAILRFRSLRPIQTEATLNSSFPYHLHHWQGYFSVKCRSNHVPRCFWKHIPCQLFQLKIRSKGHIAIKGRNYPIRNFSKFSPIGIFSNPLESAISSQMLTTYWPIFPEMGIPIIYYQFFVSIRRIISKRL